MDFKAVQKLLDYTGWSTRTAYSGKAEGWIQIRCPLAQWRHKRGVDGHPSMGIRYGEGIISSVNCFSCGYKGLLYNLPLSIANLLGAEEGHEDRIKKWYRLASRMRVYEYENLITSEFETHAESSNTPSPILDKEIYYGVFDRAQDVQQAVDYLHERGVTLTGECERQQPLFYDAEDQRVLFAVLDSNENLKGFTGRTTLSPEEYPYRGYPKIKDYLGLPKREVFLGEHLLRENLDVPILIVEGLFGYLSVLNKVGTRRLIPMAALGTQGVTGQKIEKLIQWNRPVYVLFDNDLAGEQALFGVGDGQKGLVSRLIDHLPVYVPQWPEGLADPDELTGKQILELLKTPIYSGA